MTAQTDRSTPQPGDTPMATHKISATIHLDDPLHHTLRHKAAETGTTVSELVENILW